MTKTIPFSMYNMKSIDVILKPHENIWIVGEADGDTIPFENKKDAVKAFNAIQDTKSFCKILNWV